jgi:transcriptional regulator with PAS, ATPase and Fis domain
MDKETKEIVGNAFITTNLIGQSPCFKKAIRNIRLISQFDVGVHIYGETGTGKELAARAIHYLSSRRNHPFIPISFGGLSDELILNELFGHARGAYTGADSKQPGVIQVADKGTLFIDEIDCPAPKAQIGLLRFLQEKEFKSLGSPDIRKADTRIISASNRDLVDCIETGTFRRDLYYRLDILRLDLPPLRHRGGDVFLLADHFQKKFTHEYGLPDQHLSPDIERQLLTYNWPGNVRELENFILKSCLLPGPLASVGPTGTPDDDRRTKALLPAEPIDIREGFNNSAKGSPPEADFTLDGKGYLLNQDGGAYFLYCSMRLFFQNGGGPCYIVEVSGLDIEAQVIEYRHGNSQEFSTIKMPGIQKSSNITIKKAPNAAMRGAT